MTAGRAAPKVGTGKGACGGAGRRRGDLRGLGADRRLVSRAAARAAQRATAFASARQRVSASARNGDDGGPAGGGSGTAHGGPSERDGASRRTRDEETIVPRAARREGRPAGSSPWRGDVVSSRIPSGFRRLLLHDVTSPTPDAVRRATRAGPTVGSRAARSPGGPVPTGIDRAVRVAGKNRYTPRAGFAVTGGRAVGLPWDAPEVSETVFGSRARVEFRRASCPWTTCARASRRRARPLGRSGGPS